jgi:hypothetical protein
VVSAVICTEIESRDYTFLDTGTEKSQVYRIGIISPSFALKLVVDDPLCCTGRQTCTVWGVGYIDPPRLTVSAPSYNFAEVALAW